MPVNDMEGMGLFSRTSEQLDVEILYSAEDLIKKGGIALQGQGVIPSGQVMTIDEATGKWIKYDDVNDTNEVQTITLGATPTSGGVQLVLTAPANNDPQGLGTYTTGVIDGTGNITAAEIQSAIQALGAPFTGVTVSGATGGPFTVTFAGALAATNVALITSTANTLSPATTVTVAETTPGVKGGQTATAILARAVDTTTRDQPINVYFAGWFKTAALVGLNANAITDLDIKQNAQYGWTHIP